MIYEVWKEWDACRDMLLPSLRLCGTHTEDDVLIALANGNMRLWRGEDCALVTRFVQEPRVKIIQFFIVGGNLESILNMKSQIELWAVAQGCGMAEGFGRDGWQRAASDYELGGVRMYKDLSHA